MRSKYLIFILLSLLFNFGKASETKSFAAHGDSIPDTTTVKFFIGNIENYYLGNISTLDTSLLSSSSFDELDTPFDIYNTLSNSGLGHKNLRFGYLHNIGVNMSLATYGKYLKLAENMRYMIVDKAITELKYTSGPKKEKRLAVLFAEEMFKQCYLTLDFDLDYAPGIYLNNKSNNARLAANLRYNSISKRFGATTYFFQNKLRMQENGGLLSDNDIHNIYNGRNIIPINLNNANNTIISSGFALNTYYDLSSPELLPNSTLDTINNVVNDSIIIIDTTTQKEINLGRISYEFSFKRNRLYFNENSIALSFYEEFDSILSAKTTDSTQLQTITNTIQWSNLNSQINSKDFPLYLNAGFLHRLYHNGGYFDYATMNSYIGVLNLSQASIFGNFILNIAHSKTQIKGNAECIFAGYQAGDFKLAGMWKQNFEKYGELRVWSDFKIQSPAGFQVFYYSNHFRWENCFKRSNYLNLEAQYLLKPVTVGLRFTQIGNFIYFDDKAKPQQNDDLCKVTELYSNFNFRVKRFNFIGFVSLQNSDVDQIRLPRFSGKIKAAYNFTYAKAAQIQTGFVLSYFTKYYADAYMPALRVFYLQNEIEIGNCPFVDLFVSIKVKRANIYIKYTNLAYYTSSGYFVSPQFPINGFEYFTTPHYPISDAAFYFGVNWLLYN